MEGTEAAARVPTPARLLPMLQWTAIGSLLGAGIVAFNAGPWSIRTFGMFVLAWAAHRGRNASREPATRRLWAVALGVCLVVAAAQVAVGMDGEQRLGVVLAELLVPLVFVAALAVTAREYQLPTATWWRRILIGLGPASLLAASSFVVVWQAGEPSAGVDSGWFIAVGGVRMTTPAWATTYALLAMLPLVAVMVAALVALVKTYSFANRTAAEQEAAAIARAAERAAARRSAEGGG
jgi:hypothetical protein